MVEVFRQKFGGVGSGCGCEDEAVPEGGLVKQAGVDACFDEFWCDLDDVEDPEVAEVLAGDGGFDAEFASGCGVEFLKNLGGDDACAVFGVGFDEADCDFLFYGVGAVDGVEEDVGVDEGSCWHGSVAVEVFALDFDAFGVAGGLAETGEHGVQGSGGVGDGFREKFTDEGVEAGATVLGVAAAVFQEFFGDGEGDVGHAHILCAGIGKSMGY